MHTNRCGVAFAAALAIGGMFTGAGGASAIELRPMWGVKAPTGEAAGVTAVTFRTGSVESLKRLFDGLGFDLTAVPYGVPVPRVLVSEIPNGLKAMKSPQRRARVFRKILLPLILQANEPILRDRAQLMALKRKQAIGVTLTARENGWLWSLAIEYKVKKVDFDTLLRRVDAIPPSLALAQAIEESGWGTSTYARKGNAIFGQETSLTAVRGMDGKYRGRRFKIKTFETLLAAVDAYARNLNTHPAYRKMRAERAMMRARGETPDGHALAGTLLRYSERRGAYVRTIRTIMTNYKLQGFDKAKLQPGRTIHVFKR